jgi:uncharacterized protein (TIGR02996 family)
MDEREDFLRAIREEPDDEIHRLVFADWLEDHDEAEWAALIRHQCGLARLMEPSVDPFAEAGLVDVVRLRPEVRRSILRSFDPLPVCLAAGLGERIHRPCTLFARRGLPELLRFVGDEAVGAVLAALDATKGDWGRPVRCVALGHSFSGISDAVFARFLRSRYLSNFREIDLRTAAYDPYRPFPLPRRWPAGTRLRVNGRLIGREANLRRLEKRIGPDLVVDPPHPGDQVLSDDDIPF